MSKNFIFKLRDVFRKLFSSSNGRLNPKNYFFIDWFWLRVYETVIDNKSFFPIRFRSSNIGFMDRIRFYFEYDRSIRSEFVYSIEKVLKYLNRLIERMLGDFFLLRILNTYGEELFRYIYTNLEIQQIYSGLGNKKQALLWTWIFQVLHGSFYFYNFYVSIILKLLVGRNLVNE